MKKIGIWILGCFVLIFILSVIIGTVLITLQPELKGQWIPLYAQQEWYSEKEGREKSFIGMVYDEGEGRWPRLKDQYYDRYFIDTRLTSYHIWLRQGIEVDFEKFVGKKVEIVGKKGVIQRNQAKIKVIIPARIRVLE